MEKKELMKFFEVVTILYPTYKLPTNEELKKETIKIWNQCLKPYKLKLAIEAAKNVAKENDYFNIAKIAAECEDLTILLSNKNSIKPDKIFLEIILTLEYSNPQQNFNTLSPIAKDVVGYPGQLSNWTKVPKAEFETVIVPLLKKDIAKAVKNFIRKQTALRAGINI